MGSGALEMELGPSPSWGPDGIFVGDAIVNESASLCQLPQRAVGLSDRVFDVVSTSPAHNRGDGRYWIEGERKKTPQLDRIDRVRRYCGAVCLCVSVQCLS